MVTKYAGDYESQLYVYSLNGTELWNYTSSNTNMFEGVKISADGKYIVICRGDGDLFFFGRSSSTPIWS